MHNAGFDIFAGGFVGNNLVSFLVQRFFMKTAHLSLFLAALFAFPSWVLADSLAEQQERCETERTPEACRFNLPLYCLDGEEPNFVFGITDDLKFGFSATFSEKPKQDFYQLFLVDGQVQNNSRNGARVVKLKCRGKECSGSITSEEARDLEDRFDVNQAVINFVLRKGAREYCIGKFTNDLEKLAENTRSDRVLCAYEALDSNTDITGEGYFTPSQYGASLPDDTEEPFFHFTLRGLSTGETYRGCTIVGTNVYRNAFVFESYSPDQSDFEIYGSLTDEQQAEFDSRKLDYSYDLTRTLEGASLDRGLRAFTINLSQINFSVSGSSGSSEIKRSNNARKRARKRKREKRGESGRTRVARELVLRGNTFSKQRIFKWLGFDPLGGGDILLSTNCKGDVPSQAFGKIACGPSRTGDNRQCVSFMGSSEDVIGTVCKEPYTGYTNVVIATEGLAAGDYSICFDGVQEESTLTVTSDSLGTFGIAYITDSSTLADQSSRYTFTDASISDLSTVVISSSGDCGDADLTGSFDS